jgi:hypothetical protein
LIRAPAAPIIAYSLSENLPSFSKTGFQTPVLGVSFPSPKRPGGSRQGKTLDDLIARLDKALRRGIARKALNLLVCKV